MGNKKKEAQAARRNARRIMQGYGAEWGEKLKVFNQALKPRPRWCPRIIWRKLTCIFVNVELIEKTLLGKRTDKI